MKSVEAVKQGIPPYCHPELVSGSHRFNKGFTLIEILVVVLIIGILGAIMLPQYQRAVLKSRFAALMPIAKSMADSNEAYYLEHGEYADNAEDLPVQGRRNYSDGTELEFGTTTSHAYVLATRDNDFPNNYIVYQKHSEQFPGEIHCEADANDTKAQEVCKSFGATEDIGETLTEGYLTYVLFGTGNGVAPTGDEGGNDEPDEPQTPPLTPASLGLTLSSTDPSCTPQSWGETCTYTYEGGKTLAIYTDSKSSPYMNCSSTTSSCTVEQRSPGDGIYQATFYNDGKTYTTYFDKDGVFAGGTIKFYSSSSPIYYYDANGNIVGALNSTKSAVISGYYAATYDANGNLRKIVNSSNNNQYFYDENGKLVQATNNMGQPISTTSAIKDVSTYKRSAAEMDEVAAIGPGYKRTNLCDLYPEITNCPLN